MSIWAIASMDFRIAAPIVVPRPTVRESTALSRLSRSFVGATATWANPEKTTSPIRVLAVLGLDELAHRVLRRAQAGSATTSVEHIDPETSMARMTAELETGTCAETCGRAPASPRNANAARTQRDWSVSPPAGFRRTRGTDQRRRSSTAPPAADGAAAAIGRHAARTGTASRAASANGHANDI